MQGSRQIRRESEASAKFWVWHASRKRIDRIPKLSRVAALALAQRLEDSPVCSFALEAPVVQCAIKLPTLGLTAQALSLRGELGASALATQLASEQKERSRAVRRALRPSDESGRRHSNWPPQALRNWERSEPVGRPR